MIVGRSVHNQRIERLWRDVFEGVLYIYYHLFYHLEASGFLDLTNHFNLFALHFGVFIKNKPSFRYLESRLCEAQNPHCWKQIANAVVYSWPVETEGDRVDSS